MFRNMDSPTKHLLNSYEPNDPHIVNEETEHEEIAGNCSTVTPYILKEWKENMIFWKNHDTCRRMFNVREENFQYIMNIIVNVLNQSLLGPLIVSSH